MAMAVLARTLITRQPTFSSSTLSRSFSSIVSRSSSSTSALHRFRPLVTLSEFRSLPCSNVGLRCFSTRPTTSSLNDPSPNWNNRPPKETILLDGCDFEHWLIVLEKPEGEPTRDEIIDSYIKTLAMVVGSEEEARHKIYSVSTRHYFAFGCIVSEEVSYKIKELPRVRWVLPDSYLDVKNKNYGGEPFINGEAVPYDPKYHEEWVRNNARANERSRRNDRPRNFDRSRNFERRENMQNRDAQTSPMPNRGASNAAGGPPGGNFQGGPPGGNFQSGPPGGNFQNGPPAGNFQGGPPGGNFQSGPPGGNFQGGPPAGNFQGGPPGGNFQSGPPGGNFQGGPPGGNFQNGPPGGNFQGGPPGGNFQSGPPGGNFQSGPSGGGFQNGPPSGNFQNGPPGGNFQSPPPNRGNVPHNYSAQYPNAPNPGHAENVPYNAPNVPYNAGYQNGYTPNGRDIPVKR